MTPSPDSSLPFVLSPDDFAEQARLAGWPFWRGFVLGALATVAVVLLPRFAFV